MADYSLWVSPLSFITAGFGFWYFAFLILEPVMSLKVMWWLFVIVCLHVVFISSRVGKKIHSPEHVWSQTIMATLLLIPAFVYGASDIPVFAIEFSHWLKTAQIFLSSGGIPSLNEIATIGDKNTLTGASLTILNLPPSIMLNNLWEASFTLLNLVFLAAVSVTLTKVVGVNAKWSNLLLVAVIGVIGITILNPFFDVNIIYSAGSYFIPSVMFFIAILPTIAKEKIPTGFGVIPSAMGLVILLCSGSVEAIALYTIVIVAWVLRLILDGNLAIKKQAGELLILILLPIVASLSWQQKVGSFYFSSEKTEDTLPYVGLILIAIILYKAITTPRKIIITQPWLLLPALVAFLWVLCSFWYGTNLEYVQFVLLVPLWRWVLDWYRKSALKNEVFHYPWVFGMVLAVCIIGVQFAGISLLKGERYTHAKHILQVSNLIKNKYINNGEKVAVLDKNNYPSKIWSYQLISRNKVQNVYDMFKYSHEGGLNFNKLLQSAGYSWLWVHIPTDDMREEINSNMRSDRSYLLQVSSDGLEMVSAYPHMNYSN